MTDSDFYSYVAPRRSQFIDKLHDQLSGYFKAKKFGVSSKYLYILDNRDEWHKNIIERHVANYIQNLKDESGEQGKRFPLHKYIHHGLSSQAMLFNLLGTFIADRRYAIFDEMLNIAGITTKRNVCKVELESEDIDIFGESSGQPTSIDLSIATDVNEHFFIEFKFTEAGFGGCSLFTNGDCDGRNPATNFRLCLLHTLKRKYWDIMAEHGLLTPQVINDSRCPFLDFYQAYRVLMFALEKQGEFILIHDERNPTFHTETMHGPRGVYARFLEYLPDEVRRKCHLISTQQILKIIVSSVSDSWVEELKSKYF